MYPITKFFTLVANLITGVSAEGGSHLASSLYSDGELTRFAVWILLFLTVGGVFACFRLLISKLVKKRGN